ncbi:MAG: hypothetical protein J0I91_17740 [Candidatus Accumulibacter sp.]|nr:hypothetical protein [Accumulibacter sp.]
MDTVYYTAHEAWLRVPCKVTIEGEMISVSYDIDGVNYRYAGRELAPGHFELSLDNGNGRASLHMFPNSKWIEGYWVEDGAEGFWRIFLKEEIRNLND